MPSTVSSCRYVLAEEEDEGGGGEGVSLLLSNLFDISSQFFVVEEVSYFGVGIELLYLSDVKLSHSITE